MSPDIEQQWKETTPPQTLEIYTDGNYSEQSDIIGIGFIICTPDLGDYVSGSQSLETSPPLK